MKYLDLFQEIFEFFLAQALLAQARLKLFK